MIELLRSGPADAPAVLLLAHGAGAPMTSAFLEGFAKLLAERDLAVVRFEFGYMAARRTAGKRRPPPKAELLSPEYVAAVDAARGTLRAGQRLFIGGKSMGGRVASLVADQLVDAGQVAGLICLGYPFHPPRKPEALRTAHLLHMRAPVLIVQGENDPFGSRPEVDAFGLPTHFRLHWAAGGDHDLKPRAGLGFTRAGNLEGAADAVASFMRAKETG